jgi:hypothetical protein
VIPNKMAQYIAISKMVRPIEEIIRPTNSAYRSSSQVATKTKYEEYWIFHTNNPKQINRKT